MTGPHRPRRAIRARALDAARHAVASALRRSAGWAALLLVSLLSLSLVPAGGGSSLAGHLAVIPVASPTSVASTPAGPAVHYGHPIPDMELARQEARVHGASLWPAGGFCDPIPANLTVGPVGLNATILTYPANGSGAAPLNFSWNLTVGGGGLPPYQAFVWVSDPAVSYNSSAFAGNFTLNSTGIYWVEVFIRDSTCDEVAGAWFPIQVWGSLGPAPVTVTASGNTTVLPTNVTYAVNTSAFPTGWTLEYSGIGLYGTGPNVTRTYYVPGAYNATACLVEPNGVTYVCASSPTIVLTGPSLLAWGATVTPAATLPENVTFWASMTNRSAFPNGTTMYLSVWNGLAESQATSPNGSINLTARFGCGAPWTYSVPLSGRCGWAATLTVWGAPFGSDEGILVLLSIPAYITAPGNLSSWYPQVTITYGATNGSAPLNLSINLSATGGHAPYWYSYVALGRSNTTSNGTFYAPISGAAGGWNGANVTITLTLNRSGAYWVGLSVFDSDAQNVNYALPLVTVNYTVPAAPLLVAAAASAPTVTPTGTLIAFIVNATGGAGALTVQWSFGDGTYGSSEPGLATVHEFERGGQFVPTVTVTDRSGQRVVRSLTAITVEPPRVNPGASGVGGGGSPPPAAAPGSTLLTGPWNQPVLWAPIAAALIGLAWLSRRRELRDEGEALVQAATGPP